MTRVIKAFCGIVLGAAFIGTTAAVSVIVASWIIASLLGVWDAGIVAGAATFAGALAALCGGAGLLAYAIESDTP